MINHLYIDEISWLNFPILLFHRARVIHILDHHEKSNSFVLRLLNITGTKIVFEDFFTGNLFINYDDECCHVKSFKPTRDLSIKLSDEIIQKSSLLQLINSKYGNNTIGLHFAKFIQINLFDHILKIEAYNIISNKKEDKILLIKSPYFAEAQELINDFNKSKYVFYNSRINTLKRFFHLLLKELYLRLKSYSIVKSKNTLSKKELKNGVLTIQEDSIRKDQSLRGHLHWADFSKKQKYPLHTISLNHGSSKVVEDIDLLSDNNIFIHRQNIFKQARNAVQFNDEFPEYNKDILSLWKSLFSKSSFIQKLFTVKTIFLMYKARDLAQVCKYLNIKTYVIKETYFEYSDAVQLISNQIDIKTLAYQYSNLGNYSPLMMSASDVFLTFSKNYNVLFKTKGLGPKSLKEMGYTSNGVQGRFQHKVEQLRETLLNKGVQFTIAYFDESNQNNRWGLIHSEEYKQHIVDLAQKVVDDPTMGVLVKTQFNANVIDKKFKDIPIVKQAIDTGRMLDVFAGAKRNDVYPAQVALAADICINDMIGATAALEAVDAGKRCLLLNGYNYKTLHHEQYQKANIVYKDLGSALNAIDTHRKKLANGLKSDLGDWGKIKSYFLSDLNKSGINTIKEEVDLLMNSQ